MGFSLFRKSNNDDLIKPPIKVDPNPQPSNETMNFDAGPGKLVVEDVFFIKGRGVVVTGQVESGSFSSEQQVIIKTALGEIRSTITSIEMFHKTADRAVAGDVCGLLLDNVNREDVSHGNIVTAA